MDRRVGGGEVPRPSKPNPSPPYPQPQHPPPAVESRDPSPPVTAETTPPREYPGNTAPREHPGKISPPAPRNHPGKISPRKHPGKSPGGVLKSLPGGVWRGWADAPLSADTPVSPGETQMAPPPVSDTLFPGPHRPSSPRRVSDTAVTSAPPAPTDATASSALSPPMSQRAFGKP